MLKNPGMTVSESKAETCALMVVFVKRSNTTTSAAIRKGNSLLLDGIATGRAQRRKFRITSYIQRVFPAALAFNSVSALDFDGIGSFSEFHLGHNKDSRQICRKFLEQWVEGVGRC